MAMIAQLCEYHLHTCSSVVCEIGMNVDMFRRVDEMVEQILDTISHDGAIKKKVDAVDKIKLFNMTLSMFIKVILQDCSERPSEYSDLRFSRYVVDKAATFQQFQRELKELVATGN